MAGTGWPPSLLILANCKELQANSYTRSTATFPAPKQCGERLNANLAKYFS